MQDNSRRDQNARTDEEVRKENERLKEENRRLKALLKSFGLRSASSLQTVSLNAHRKEHFRKPSGRESAATLGRPYIGREPSECLSEDVQESSRLPNEKISLFRALFRGREDVYALRWENRKGRSGYSPACANEWNPLLCQKPCAKCHNCKYIPLSDDVIRDHMLGKRTVGIYPLLPNEACWFLAADFDKEGWQEDARVFLDVCKDLDVPAALERSRSGCGGHVWIFFEKTIPATLARKFGSAILTRAMDRRHGMGFDSYDRFFPNQDTMPKGGFGNLIALPLQGIPAKQGNTLFLNDDLIPHARQMDYLASLKRIAIARVEEIVAEASRRGQVIGIRVSADDDGDEVDPWTLPPSRRRAERPLQKPLPPAIRAVVGNQLYLEKDGLSAQLMNRLIRLAAFQNPEFYRAQKMRLSTFGKPRVVACAEDFPKHIALPGGCLDDLKFFLDSNGIGLNIQDERYPGVSCEFRFQGQLDDQQNKAVQEIMRFDNGVLVAPTGFGKTVVAARLTAERRANTLVVVHRKSLLDQWRERLAAFLGLDIKKIGTFSGERKMPGGIIDVASIQSLCRKGQVNDLVADYGHVIIDECHHIPAFTFERVLREAKAKYVLGLTATPVRKDGLHPIIVMQCGPVRVRIRAQDAGRLQAFRQIVLLRKTEFKLPADSVEPTIHEVYAAIVSDSKRNAVILRDISDALADDRRPLVLTERTAHLEYLEAELKKTGCPVVVLRGGMGKRQRVAAYDKLESIPEAEQRVVLATGRYAGEGFDDPRLDTLFLAMPISWRGTLQQYVGRLHRARRGKTEVCVYDYVDQHVPMLMRMLARRLKGYRAMGYETDGQLELL